MTNNEQMMDTAINLFSFKYLTVSLTTGSKKIATINASKNGAPTVKLK